MRTWIKFGLGILIEIIYTHEFERDIKKIKDQRIRERIKKLIRRIGENPDVGKPLRYELEGLRSLKIPPFRILYESKSNSIILHKFEHRKKVYRH